MNQVTRTHSAAETIAWACDFAQTLKPGDVICLHGDLGAGKTTLVKGLAEALGLARDEQVTSPTFVIMHRYTCRIPLYHFDCYRMQSPEDLLAIGFEDFLNSGGIACIEWPEKAGNLIPAPCYHIEMTHEADDQRLIRIEKR